MNAKDLFKTKEERDEVKGWLIRSDGKITLVLDKQNNIIFPVDM